MSRSARAHLSLPLIAVMLTSSGALAQAPGLPDAAAWRDTMRRLAAEQREVLTELTTSDTMAGEVTTRGGLRLLTSKGLEEAGRRVLDEVTAAQDRWFGGRPVSTEGFTITVRDRRLGHALRRGILRGVVTIETIGGAQRQRIQFEARIADRSGEELSQRVLREYAGVVDKRLPPPIKRWVQSVLPIHIQDRERRSEALYQAVTATGASQLECVNGNLAACVEAFFHERAGPDRGPQFISSVRTDLLLTALETGGPGAWDRLRAADHATAVQALEAAAGIGIEALLGGWRESLLAVRPHQPPIQAGVAIAAFGWLVVLALGTVGATRWL